MSENRGILEEQKKTVRGKNTSTKALLHTIGKKKRYGIAPSLTMGGTNIAD